MTQLIKSHNLGFPRIGANRELKKALEAYWKGAITAQDLYNQGQAIRRQHWALQAQAGLDLIPTGDFAWYDQVLTLSATLGNIPSRHRKNLAHDHHQAESHSDQHAEGHNCCGSVPVVDKPHLTPCQQIDIDTLFRVARGKAPTGQSTAASDMTKWFDTNYHYLVPEFYPEQEFALSWTQIIDETLEAIELGYAVKPVIIGPLTYLWLGREKVAIDNKGKAFKRLSLLSNLIPVYKQLISALASTGAEWIQIDEPILSLDLPSEWQSAFESTYNQLQSKDISILLANYFGNLGANLTTALNLPVAGLHIDAVRAADEVTTIIDRLSPYKVLSIGVVDGRNIWRNDLQKSLTLLQTAADRLGDRLWVAPSCSLLHSPVDLEAEQKLSANIKQWLAFAKQKITEVVILKTLLTRPFDALAQQALQASNIAQETRKTSTIIHNTAVKQRLTDIQLSDYERKSRFEKRIQLQQLNLGLPLFPTTTIGSFPQTAEIRSARAAYKKGQLAEADYTQRIKEEIAFCIKQQEELEIDVFVHGEAERNDMVEYFGEQLSGFAFTENGWVQSYGSRCVKPPIIYGDVSREKPMTLVWTVYAQSLTEKPVKGMLTGPITILCWSFVRDDQPRSTTAQQIALALRDEVIDLEKAGIKVIQIDEPAIREGLPLRQSQQPAYLEWAVNAFRLSAAGVEDETQIHTHMCYSEFNSIIKAIAALDADVITIETSRSDGELLAVFEEFDYPNDIGPGVYDIHSPNEPTVEQMVNLLQQATTQIPVRRLWVNPDCGLKTRSWAETTPALRSMVNAAKTLRAQYADKDPVKAKDTAEANA